MRILKPGGTLLFSTFLPGNLAEVAQATGRSLPLPDVAHWHSYLPEGLRPVSEEEASHTLHFASPATYSGIYAPRGVKFARQRQRKSTQSPELICRGKRRHGKRYLPNIHFDASQKRFVPTAHDISRNNMKKQIHLHRQYSSQASTPMPAKPMPQLLMHECSKSKVWA